MHEWHHARWRGGLGGGSAYLQLPEDLRLAAGLQVLQSLGPEAVFLVQGAMATRGADESMTTQEPEHESGPEGSRGRGLLFPKKAARGNAAG